MTWVGAIAKWRRMAAKDLGNKFVCFKCSAKFYDLKKPEPVCPKCGSDQRENPALKAPAEGGRRGRLAAVPKVIEPTAAPEESESESVLEDEEDIEEFEEVEEGDLPADEEEP